MSTFVKDMLDEVFRHAVKEYPFECCGIIIGKADNNEEDILYQCTNIQNKLHEKDPETFVRDARTAFYIDPGELMKILKETDEKGLEIKTFYHSHPDHEAYFSQEDEDMALFEGEPVYPETNYLVISVYDREIKDQALFAWAPDKKAFAKQKDLILV